MLVTIEVKPSHVKTVPSTVPAYWTILIPLLTNSFSFTFQSLNSDKVLIGKREILLSGMGNICSTDDTKAKPGKKSGPRHGKKKKKVVKKISDEAVENAGTVSLTSPTADVNPLVVTDPPDRQQTSESGDANQRSSSSLRRQLSDIPRAKVTQDFEPLSEAKIGFVRAWVDMINKTDLRDPQDVMGYERQVAMRSAEDVEERRRSSILQTLRKAQIESEHRGHNSSMDVEHSIMSQKVA